jgi:hypothetical protein
MIKIIKTILGAIILISLILVIAWQFDFSNDKPNWGITFSQTYAEKDLKLDWKEAYSSILNDMNFKKIRLVAYWNLIEPTKNEFNFNDLDWQIEEASKSNKEIILALGFRAPRWPECHLPDWVNSSEQNEFHESVLSYITTVIKRYQNYDSIKIWQVENEPLLSVFGECPPPSRNFLKEEISLVKSLDPSRNILITDSGELSLWLRTAGLSEIFGTTLYRIVWNSYTGWWEHIYPPALYSARASLVKSLTKTEDVIIAELQAEPWISGNRSINEVSLEEQAEHFSLDDLQKSLEIAQKTGIRDIYLWGAEWWYWRKTHGNSDYWDFMKTTLNRE